MINLPNVIAAVGAWMAYEGNLGAGLVLAGIAAYFKFNGK